MRDVVQSKRQRAQAKVARKKRREPKRVVIHTYSEGDAGREAFVKLPMVNQGRK